MARTTQTVEIDFSDHIGETSFDADPATWPTASMELDVRWHPAEPDVGIMSEEAELVGASYSWQGEWFTDDSAFAAAVYSTIGEDIEMGEDGLLALIRKIENEVDLYDA